MGDTGFSSFKIAEDKTNRVLREIEEAYGWPKERRNQSYAALRAVLHAVRDRLTVEETAQLGARSCRCSCAASFTRTGIPAECR
jgi:hypothetical protein